MNELSPELSEAELRAAETALRGQSPDPAAFGMLTGLPLHDAQRLLRPGEHMPALGLMAVICLVGRLRGSGAAADRKEIDGALLAYRLAERLGTALPAAHLTLDELRACQAELRGERSDSVALASFLGATPRDASTFRRLLDDERRAFAPVLLACLVARLHGRVVPMSELVTVAHAVFAHRHELEQADIQRGMAH